MKMHAGEFATSVELVRRLLAAQLPQWAGLPLVPLASSGTVNALYRFGDEMIVRLPRMPWAAGALEKEVRFLPGLAPLLPVEVPRVLARGEPGEGYPWEWGIYPWHEGEHPEAGSVSDGLARELAALVTALHGAPVEGDPPPGRGAAPLAEYDETVRAGLVELEGLIDTDAARAAWEESRRAPAWAGELVWTHGDLMPGNLLLRDGRLAVVLDWEGCGLGDPAADLAVAWNLLAGSARETFRRELDVNDAAWLRGRGWALWTGVAALPYYVHTNPVLAANGRYRIGEVLDDHRQRSI